MQAGGRNSKFFHRRVSNRRRRNKLKGLFDHHGVWQTSPHGIEDVVIHYFQDLFARKNLDTDAQSRPVLQTITHRVTLAMNSSLLTPYSMEEAKVALFQMHPSKAPGLDGMSHFFFLIS